MIPTSARASGKTLHLSALFTTQLRRSSSIAADNGHHFHSTGPDFEALLQSRRLSGKLDLDEAIGYFNSLILIRPFPDIWRFDRLFGSLSKLGHYSVVVSMFRAVTGFPEFRPQTGTLTILMNCLYRLQRPDLSLSVLAAILKLGLRPNSHTLTTLLQVLCAGGSTETAAELFHEIGEESPGSRFAYSAFINGLCKAGDVPEALRVLREMYGNRRVRPDAGCFAPIIDALCKTDRVDDGLTLFAEMIERQVPPVAAVCNSLIHGLFKSGRWEEAERLFTDMPLRYGIPPDVRTYNVVIDGLCKEERCSEAVAVFEAMVERGLEPTVVTFGSLLTSLCRCGRLEEGSWLLREMPRFGVRPSAPMCTVVFDALCKEGRISEALGLVGGGFDPDVVVYTSLIQGLCRVGSVGQGFSVLATMVKRGVEPNPRTVVALLRGLCAEGFAAEAAELLRGVAGDDRLSNEFTHAVVIDGLCKAGETAEALDLLERACGNVRFRPDVFCFNPLIDWLCKERRLDEAVRLFEAMIRRGVVPHAITCGPLIRGLRRAGRREEANGLLLIGAMNDQRGGVRPNAATFNSLLSGFCKRGRWNEASELSRAMERFGVSHDSFTLSSMVDALCKEGRIPKALDLVEEMATGGVKSDVVVYNSLIHGFCCSGQWVEVVRYLEKMEKESVPPNVVTFTILADSLNKQRRSKEALRLLRDMVEKGLVPDSRSRKLLRRILAVRSKTLRPV